ncbi:hypothetical protein AVEN_256810-1 [Araneus ventricosus]|uniref:Uncharacterized protein n=1 Tax=Araneus ventricosus TaxID=182803 RepID=A0A4Y2VJM7_ARAVE|nr:hypothetical protein AVEN_256810-1 [Araneus ventricosus]
MWTCSGCAAHPSQSVNWHESDHPTRRFDGDRHIAYFLLTKKHRPRGPTGSERDSLPDRRKGSMTEASFRCPPTLNRGARICPSGEQGRTFTSLSGQMSLEVLFPCICVVVALHNIRVV